MTGDTWATTSFDPKPRPSAFVQWKGTDICVDLHCECGYHGHFDGFFAYGLRCAECGKEWTMPHSFGLLPGDEDELVQETFGPHNESRPIEAAVDYAPAVNSFAPRPS